MSAFWLTYKPLSNAAPRGWPPEQMDALVRKFEADPSNANPLWRIASSKAASIGDRVYLFKQGAGPRGIFGVGELIEAPREQTDPTDIDAGPTQRARLRLTNLVHPLRGFLLDYESVADVLPKTLVEAQQSGNGVPEEVQRELDHRLARVIPGSEPLTSDQVDNPEFDPDSIADERDRAVRAIRIRRGQADFRATLMAAYGARCAISGCAVPDVLEAAHIFPYLGRVTNHVSNGLLLRADIHTLFDGWLVAIEPTTRKIVIASALEGSSYAALAGRKLRPSGDLVSGPSTRNLEKRFAHFNAKHRQKPNVSG